MNKGVPNLFGFLLLIFAIPNALCQTNITDPVDGQGWYSLSFKHSFAPKWKYDFQYQRRYINNLKTYNASYLSAGASYKLTKALDLLTEYRQAWVAKSIYHRYSVGFQYNQDFKNWEFGIRGLLQNQIQDLDDPSKPDKAKGYYRFRFSANYSIIKKLDAFVSVEPIFRIGGNSLVDNWRDQLGVKYKIAKHLKVEAYYIFRPDYGKATYNRYFHILGLGLDYSIKTWKKKKTTNEIPDPK